MKIYLLIIFIIIFVSECFSQTIKEYEAKLKVCEEEINKLDKAVLNISSNFKSFKIRGKIEDRDEDFTFIHVWGIAVPIDENYNTYGTLLEESNIFIFNPKKDKINYNYYDGGIHYFREKKYGKNAFGMKVPIYVYGDIFLRDKQELTLLEAKKKELLSEKSQILMKLEKERIRKKIKSEFNYITNLNVNSNTYNELISRIGKIKMIQFKIDITFINRAREMAELRNYLEGMPNSILFLYGPKSSGKTTLMYRLFEQMEAEKEYEINFLNLREIFFDHV